MTHEVMYAAINVPADVWEALSYLVVALFGWILPRPHQRRPPSDNGS